MKIHLRALCSWFVERLNPVNWMSWMIGFDGLFPYRSHVSWQVFKHQMRNPKFPATPPVDEAEIQTAIESIKKAQGGKP